MGFVQAQDATAATEGLVNNDGRLSFGDSTQACWYVLQTIRRKEQLAQEFLGQRGISTYLPLVVLWPRPIAGKAITPMFSGYLFVHADLPGDFSRVSWTPGVKALVGFGSGPIPLDPAAIDFLRAREGSDGLIRCSEPLARNDQVRIVKGPFQGLTAIFEQRLPARERVRVLIDILARDTPVELPERWVRRA